jgi:NADPH:quinone reductase-like Zn-dependent oxidoreductase
MKPLKDYLMSLGATHVFKYDDLSDKSLDLRGKVREWAGKTGIRLGLNCVGGKETAMMAKLLG